MFIPDMPNAPPQNVPVMIVQANQAQASNATTARTIGICAASPNQNYSLENVIEPIGSSQDYFQMYENRTVTGPATVTVLQQPKHGVLRLVTQADVGTILPSGGDPVDPAAGLYFYLPESAYVGNDSATILVDFGSVKVTVKYYFHAINGPVGDNWIQEYCAPKGMYWKISSTLDANGASTLTSVEHVPAVASTPDTLTSDSLSAWLSLAQLDAKVARVGREGHKPRGAGLTKHILAGECQT